MVLPHKHSLRRTVALNRFRVILINIRLITFVKKKEKGYRPFSIS